MPDLLLLALGALSLLAVQAVGMCLLLLIGERPYEVVGWWVGFTGWLVWLGPYIVRQRRRHRAYLARQERMPAPELGEKWLNRDG
ncbi:hypothetical protein AB0I81_22670 [Nonomuraea sp. NPDC050404]|uniref:hypothetical protein n=1 Tax=Nonomuraea sp. NPDC050404 TaxID=3155783 RepID=UPI0033CF4260